MFAGKLDRRVTIRRQGTARNEFGEPTGSYADYLIVWASKRGLYSSESRKADEMGASAASVFEIRYSTEASAITPLDRLAIDGRDYDIQSIEEIGRRVGYRIIAVARTD